MSEESNHKFRFQIGQTIYRVVSNWLGETEAKLKVAKVVQYLEQDDVYLLRYDEGEPVQRKDRTYVDGFYALSVTGAKNIEEEKIRDQYDSAVRWAESKLAHKLSAINKILGDYTVENATIHLCEIKQDDKGYTVYVFLDIEGARYLSKHQLAKGVQAWQAMGMRHKCKGQTFAWAKDFTKALLALGE